MKKLKLNVLKPLALSVWKETKKHAPAVLTGIGIGGMVTTTIMAVNATPKAIMLINERECEEKIEKLPKIEAVKTVWKCYLPAAVTGALSIACLVGATNVSARRNAALATAYSISESALKDYQAKALEVVGEKKEQAIRDAVAKDQIEKNPVSTTKEDIFTEKGGTLCYDSLSGRYFKSDIDAIRKAENNINRQMMNDNYVYLNEFYDELRLPHIDVGDMLGWHIDKGYIDLAFSSQLADDGTPCLVIEYRLPPTYNIGY